MEAFLQKIFEWGWLVIIALVGVVRQMDVARFNEMSQRVLKLDERQDRLTEMLHELNLSATRTEEQVRRLVSHADSEQRTRENTTQTILQEIKSLRKTSGQARVDD